MATLSAVLLSASLLGAGGVSGHPFDQRVRQDAAGSEGYQHGMLASMKLSLPTSVDLELPDVELVNQHGDRVRLLRDVVGDRIVVMNFVYTDCTTVCPALSAVFSLVQEALGGRLGREVVLVSLSVDPARDTPQRLNAYAAKQRARAGWEWLTGDPATVDQVLRGMAAYAPGVEQQPAMVLVGDRRSREWTRFLGFPGTDQLLAHIDALAAASTVGASEFAQPGSTPGTSTNASPSSPRRQ